jgi:hypothetical protein
MDGRVAVLLTGLQLAVWLPMCMAVVDSVYNYKLQLAGDLTGGLALSD